MRMPHVAVARCGACDTTEVLALCEQCHEPTCARHLVRALSTATRQVRYICCPCQEESLAVGAETLTMIGHLAEGSA